MSSDELDDIPLEKEKPKMVEKSPISVIKKLCDKKNDLLMFEHLPRDSNPKEFFCVAKAFGTSAEGCGRSKKGAEHDACVNLITRLKTLGKFKNELPMVSKVKRTPDPVKDGDAISELYDICVQRKCPLPIFSEAQKCGEPHRPTFTVQCTVSSIKRSGRFSTIKGARQLAARAILQIIQSFPQNDELQQVAVVEAEPPKKLFQTYLELKKAEIKPRVEYVRDRYNYFLRLPKDDRDEAKRILLDTSGKYNSNQIKVDLTCKALQLQYNIQDLDANSHLKIFSLKCDHDCVIINKEPELFDDVIKHFKIMINAVKID